MQDPILRYAEIKQQISLLNNELDFLQDEVTKRIRELAGDELKPVDTPAGTFVIARAKTWKYSDDYEAKAKALDELKKEEQATGLATFEVKEQLRFNIHRDV